MSNDTQDAIAAFLAKGGKVQKVATGASNGMTDRQWYKAVRDDEKVRIDDNIDEALSERRHEIGAGLGLDALNEFNMGVHKHGAHKMLGWKK